MDKQDYLILINDLAKWAVENTENTSEARFMREKLLQRLWNSIDLLYPKSGKGEIKNKSFSPVRWVTIEELQEVMPDSKIPSFFKRASGREYTSQETCVNDIRRLLRLFWNDRLHQADGEDEIIKNEAKWTFTDCPSCGHPFIAKDRFGVFCCIAGCGWHEGGEVK